MCVCLCVCPSCICISMHTRVHYISTFVGLCVCVCVCIPTVYQCIRACIIQHLFVGLSVCLSVSNLLFDKHACTHTHTQTQTHTRTHAHAHAQNIHTGAVLPAKLRRHGRTLPSRQQNPASCAHPILLLPPTTTLSRPPHSSSRQNTRATRTRSLFSRQFHHHRNFPANIRRIHVPVLVFG